MGTVSSERLSSVRMILEGLRFLEQLLKELSSNYMIHLHTCLTVQVETLHEMGHFKEQFPTLLQYAQNLANTVYESIKRVVQWAAYYYTHEKSYYPVVSQATQLVAPPRMTHLKPSRKLKDREREVMLEWAANDVKAVRQPGNQAPGNYKVQSRNSASKHVRHFCPINGKDNNRACGRRPPRRVRT
ncbi:hypothetical protein P5673_009557 [Acropora cervicornis]|uniref:Uncharacterized protein n=1 Tax=Acropora cervicornis TaxID=6130 RepID=A0AAD9QRJ4_ACRCE|nr:hypothetical protein P5673_009557 [Acropora cervicornis]